MSGILSAVKLCRFELTSEPGRPRSGIYHEGKVYETDGKNAIGIHGVQGILFLSPVSRPPSLRFAGDDGDYEYGNPSVLSGPSELITLPEDVLLVEVAPCLGVVVASAGRMVSIDEADSFVLGWVPAAVLVDGRPDSFRGSKADLGIALGAVITTPEELEDRMTGKGLEQRLHLRAVIKQNGEVIASGVMLPEDLCLPSVLEACSQTYGIATGDLILLPSMSISDEAGNPLRLVGRAGDSFQIQVDQLGGVTVTLE